LPRLPNRFGVAGAAVEIGADILAESALILFCGFPKFANMSPRPPEGALAEGADGPELADLSRRLKPLGVAVGDATGFVGLDCSWVAFAKMKAGFEAVSPNSDALVVCGAELLADERPPRLNKLGGFEFSF